MSFNRIISAAERAKPQFSPVHGKPEDNRDVLKEFALDAMRALAALVEDAGGDNDYIQSYLEGLQNDLDHCFRKTIENASEPDFTDLFKPRVGLLTMIVNGASMR